MKKIKLLLLTVTLFTSIGIFSQSCGCDDETPPPPPPPPTFTAPIVEFVNGDWKCYEIGWYWNGWMLWYGKHEIECVANPAFTFKENENKSKHYASVNSVLDDILGIKKDSKLSIEQSLTLVAKSLNVEVKDLFFLPKEMCSRVDHHGFLWLTTTITSIHKIGDSYYMLLNSTDIFGNTQSTSILLGTGPDGLTEANRLCSTLQPPA